MPARWWECWPERLTFELEALGMARIPYTKDEAAFAQGVLRLQIQLTIRGEVLPLVAVFPAFYPYMRFEVYAPTLSLSRHQNPLQKNLCLINQATENWHVTDTLAEFLTKRLPLVLEAAESTDQTAVALLEEHQGEPFTAHYPYKKDAIILTDSGWALESERSTGTFTLAIEEGVSAASIRGAVLEVKDDSGRVLASADPALVNTGLFPRRLQARWIRVSEPIGLADPGQVTNQIATRERRLMDPMPQRIGREWVDVVGVVFPEEVTWRQSADGWLFVVRHGDGRGRRDRGLKAYFARSGRFGRTDVASRVPELAFLPDKRIAVFGLGGLGAPMALELARAGVGGLSVLDGDFVEPGTSVRWPLGLPVAGREKVAGIAEFVRRHYPRTRINTFPIRLGEPLAGDQELRAVDAMLDGADLVLDATAERGLQHLLSDLAQQHGLPYVAVWTTAGAWGGMVIVLNGTNASGCWVCLQHALTEGIIPAPPADATGGVQPAGCASPTFTGSGFDVSSIALVATRIVAGELGRGVRGAYPPLDGSVVRIALRTSDGAMIPAQAETFVLEPRPHCQTCRGD